MAGRRRRAARRLPWLWLGVLILMGVVLFLARSPELRRPAAPTVEPRATPGAASRTPEPALAAVATPPATSRAATTAIARPVATATARPAAAATAFSPPSATAPPSTTATRVPAPSPAATPPQASKVVALTFDAGADRGYAEDILDTLRAEHVVASFGITGQWAKANPELVRRMAADGHMVFNHTLDHQSFTGLSDQRGGLSPAARRAELEQAEAIIAPLIGHSTKPYYRLPYGDDDARVASDVAVAGYSHKVGWTIDTLGWRGASAVDIVERSVKLAAAGAIYVLHVGHASQDGPALARIVTALREHGYGFVTIEALT